MMIGYIVILFALFMLIYFLFMIIMEGICRVLKKRTPT